MSKRLASFFKVGYLKNRLTFVSQH